MSSRNKDFTIEQEKKDSAMSSELHQLLARNGCERHMKKVCEHSKVAEWSRMDLRRFFVMCRQLGGSLDSSLFN